MLLGILLAGCADPEPEPAEATHFDCGTNGSGEFPLVLLSADTWKVAEVAVRGADFLSVDVSVWGAGTSNVTYIVQGPGTYRVGQLFVDDSPVRTWSDTANELVERPAPGTYSVILRADLPAVLGHFTQFTLQEGGTAFACDS